MNQPLISKEAQSNTVNQEQKVNQNYIKKPLHFIPVKLGTVSYPVPVNSKLTELPTS